MHAYVAALARAYSMSELVPVDDPRLRRAVEDPDGDEPVGGASVPPDDTAGVEAAAEDTATEEDGDGSARPLVQTFRVGRLGLKGPEGELEDPDGSLSELARDLGAAGVTEVRLPERLEWEHARELISSLRSEGGPAGDACRAALSGMSGLRVSFAPGAGEDPELLPEPREAWGEDRFAAQVSDLFDRGWAGEGSGADPGAALDEAIDRFLASLEDGEEDGGSDDTSAEAVVEEVRKTAADVLTRADSASVAGAVERLAGLGLGEDSGGTPSRGAMDLARELLSPRVAAQIALQIGRERDELVRERLVRIAAALGTPMAMAFADALVDTDDRAARRTYLDALVALGPEGKAEAEKMLEDGRWFVVRNGAAILGGVGTEEDVHHLTSHLAHDDARVRRTTVMALARIGGEDAGILLVGMVDDPDPDVRAAVATALGALGVERAVKPLLQRLEKEEEQKVQVQVIRALGALGDPGAVTAIEKRAVASFFSRPPVPVRVAAYRALASIGTPHALELVEAAREDKDEEVRTTARAIIERREREEREADASPGEPDEGE